MGSYPSVAAGYKPESAMQGYADMQKLEENQLAQKVQQQQLQEGQLTIQAKQQALSDVQTMNDAWTHSLRLPQASAAPAGAVPLSALLRSDPNMSSSAGGAPTAAAGVVGAVPASPAQGPDSGAPVYDHDKIVNYLASNGKGSLIPGLQKSWLELDKTAGEVQAAKDKHTADATDYFGDLGIAVRNANYDPAAVGTALAHAAA